VRGTPDHPAPPKFWRRTSTAGIGFAVPGDQAKRIASQLAA
jgi:hypothetical protein